MKRWRLLEKKRNKDKVTINQIVDKYYNCALKYSNLVDKYLALLNK